MLVSEYIDNYLKNYQNYKPHWNYEDGCVLMGCRRLYEVTGEKKYLDFIIRYLEPVIDNDGTIKNYETDKDNIDSFNSGKALFIAYKETGDEKYRKAIEFLIKRLMAHPRIKSGNFWHKDNYPNQVWLDGLYMAQPLYMEYETLFNDKKNYDDILNQFKNVRKYMFNKEKGLYYHGYDDARIQLWADKETGLSKNFWLRSIGWYMMSLIDVIDAMSKEMTEYCNYFCSLFEEAVSGILRYQDNETKLFYQVVDHPEVQGNYTETSGSAMIAYSIMKACAIGVLDREKYAVKGIEILIPL